MITIHVEHFNIEQICHSGQCFRMRKNERGNYEVVAFGNYLELSQEGNELTLDCSQEEYDAIWKSYLSLDVDYHSIIAVIDQDDEYMNTAMEFGWGMRILKQDFWEIIISFLISQQNNIPRIQKCIRTICERYGTEKRNKYGEPYYTFPTPQALASLDESELRDCNLGYRAKYILRTAQSVVQGDINLETIAALPYVEARTELQKLYGVGIKVAECICLYGLHHLDAFPIDTHIKHVLDENYPDGFPFDRYRGVAGVFQQYAFYYDLFLPKMK